MIRGINRGKIFACIASAVTLTAVLAIETVAQSATSNTFSFWRGDFGIATGAGFFNDSNGKTDSTDHLYTALKDFQTLHVRFIRTSIPWQNFEPYSPSDAKSRGKDKYNWDGIDNFVRELNLPEFHDEFRVIATLGGPPNWATSGPNLSLSLCKAPYNTAAYAKLPYNLDAFAAASGDLATHLKGTIRIFEMENSPNIAVSGDGHDVTWNVPNPCGYTQMLKKTYSALHAANGAALVMTGGSGGTKDVDANGVKNGGRIAGDEWLADLYAQGAEPYFDAVGYHPYTHPDFPCDPNAKECTFNPNAQTKDPYGMNNGWYRMLNAYSIMNNAGDGTKTVNGVKGKDKKIWMTEFGSPSGHGESAQHEKDMVQQGYQRASQLPWARATCWFNYQDHEMAGDQAGETMGLVTTSGAHKPAFDEYKALSSSAKIPPGKSAAMVDDQ